MRLWRISTHADLSGEGGLLASGRWHSRGSRVVYLADHPASALVEVLVHLEVDPEDIPQSYQLMAVDLPDNIAFQAIEPNRLAPNWHNQVPLTRESGDQWLRENQTALLRVPSAIVPFAMNWLLNAAHADAAKARIVEVIRAPFDQRLFGVDQD
jgi:RES domain-containing protein